MFKRGFACAGLLALSVSSAAAMDHGWYWGIEAGLDEPRDVGYDCLFCFPSTATFTSGAALIGTLGTHVEPNIRIELEVAYRNDQQFGGVNVHEVSVMANAIYDLRLMDDLALSLGGGLGTGFIHHEYIGDTDTTFAYQLIGGLSWSISPNVELFAQYRYMSTSGPTFNNGSFDIVFDDFRHDTITLGARFGL